MAARPTVAPSSSAPRALRAAGAADEHARRYRLELPGLAEAVAGARPSAKHAALLQAVRRSSPALARTRLATTRDGQRLLKRQVLTAAGALVHEDHRVWLAAQAAADGDEFARTAARLRELDHRLTECAISTLYLVQDRGGRQQEFMQLGVEQLDEFVERRLFDVHGPGWRGTPRTLDELIEQAEDGPRFDDAARVPVRPGTYRLRQVIDVAEFLAEANAVEGARRALQRQREIVVTDVHADGSSSATRRATIAELDPDGARWAWPGQRLFDDWAACSAGRSGRRLCAHWVLQTADYTDPQGRRWMSLVPMWTYPRKLAALDKLPARDRTLYGRLESIDRRTGVPFGWYFWMLHGNRVHDTAGRRVLRAAEWGLIVLPEHDYQVLRRWAERPYGF